MPSKNAVDDARRDRILMNLEHLGELERVNMRIRMVEARKDSLNIKIAWKHIQAFGTDKSPDDVEVPPADTLEEVQSRRSRLLSDIDDVADDIATRSETVRDELVEDMSQIVDNLTEEGDTKKSKIIVLRSALEMDLGSGLVASVVGCSTSHARKFRWDDESGEVVIDEATRNRRKNRFAGSKKERIRDRDVRKCVNCGSIETLHVHHIIPVEHGGTPEVENGATLCKDCHNTLHSFNRGYGYDYETQEQFWDWADE